MSSDSESTPKPMASQSEGESIPNDSTSIKPSQADVHRVKNPDEHRGSPSSTPDSMKVEIGSAGATDSVDPTDETRANPKKSGVPETEDTGSDASWEQVQHEGAQGSSEQPRDMRPVFVRHGGVEESAREKEKKKEEEDGSGEDIAPEFRPRTPRPYEYVHTQ